MLTETAVSAILQVGITGAGLVLAVYTLISALSQRIFKERAKLLHQKIEEFEEQRNKITPESSNKEIQNLGKLKREIEGIKIFPRYMGIGIGVTFALYMFSVIVASGWLANPSARTSAQEFFVLASFGLANTLFLVVGLYTIGEVFLTMKKEFDEIKKKQDEVKKRGFSV